MTAPIVYLNGRLVPFAEAALPLHDAGFVSGATVVDNARTFRHKLFRWPDHLARFRRDCATCYVPLEATDEHLTATAEELVAHNAKLLPSGGELQLVTFATPGPLGFYLGDAPNGPPTLGMVTYPLPSARYRPFFTDGVTLAMAGMQHADPIDLLPPRVKHRSRLHWHVAERTVNDPASRFHRPGAVPVVFGRHGSGDTAVGGILAVIGDTVIRPVPDSVQESISLKVVGELCASVGLTYTDAPLDLRHLCRPVGRADAKSTIPRVSELTLAGTGFCLAGVREFAQQLGVSRTYDWPGPVYRRLLAAWSDLVGVDIQKQFTG
ncbi:MAG: aminotransferase class IV [Gemmataceae bacterium]|nr:aminotransferase class IV [Gemmataceae bacterium]